MTPVAPGVTCLGARGRACHAAPTGRRPKDAPCWTSSTVCPCTRSSFMPSSCSCRSRCWARSPSSLVPRWRRYTPVVAVVGHRRGGLPAPRDAVGGGVRAARRQPRRPPGARRPAPVDRPRAGGRPVGARARRAAPRAGRAAAGRPGHGTTRYAGQCRPGGAGAPAAAARSAWWSPRSPSSSRSVAGVQVYRVGDSGARAVWAGRVSQTRAATRRAATAEVPAAAAAGRAIGWSGSAHRTRSNSNSRSSWRIIATWLSNRSRSRPGAQPRAGPVRRAGDPARRPAARPGLDPHPHRPRDGRRRGRRLDARARCGCATPTATAARATPGCGPTPSPAADAPQAGAAVGRAGGRPVVRCAT